MVLDLLEGFKKHQLTIIPRKENVVADALAVSSSVFLLPIYPSKQYQIEVRHIPSILDNVHDWQVFDDDEQINRFMDISREFDSLKLDQENMFKKEESAE